MTFSSPIRIAAEFLLPIKPGRIADRADAARAGKWLVPWAALVGLGYVVIYWGFWSLYGEYMKIRFTASAAVVVADLLFGGFAMMSGFATVVAGRSSRPSRDHLCRTIVAVVAVALARLTILLVWPRGYVGPWPSGWRASAIVEPFYPVPVYRPVLLMPMWAAWSAMLAMRVGRTAASCSPRFAAMAGGIRARTLLLYWLGLTGITMLFAGPQDTHLPIGIIVALGVMLSAYVTAFVLGRRFGGQTEATVMTAGLAGQFAFLLVLLPAANAIYSY